MVDITKIKCAEDLYGTECPDCGNIELKFEKKETRNYGNWSVTDYETECKCGLKAAIITSDNE